MTCTHINEVKNKISNLTTLIQSGGIHKEVGPYLTPSEVKKYTHGSVYNSSEDEIRQLGKNIRVINETSLKKELDVVYGLLASCECYSQEKKSRKDEKKEREISERDKKNALKSLEEAQKKVNREKLKSKKKELTELVNKNSEEGNNCGKEVLELQKLYQLLISYKKDNNSNEERKINEKITKISSDLIEKGIGFDEVEEISQICEKMAKLKFETEYQARIEFSTSN